MSPLAALDSVWQLARLALLSGCRFRGPYWAWRWHTAFGRGTPPRRELLAAALRYGRWIGRMRRLG